MERKTPPPWKKTSDLRIEAQMDRFDEIMSTAIVRWRAAEIVVVDRAWEKLVPLLPDDRVWDWLDHLAACVNSSLHWSPIFPVADTSTKPAVPVEAEHIVERTLHNKLVIGTLTPARARREARYADVQRLMAGGVRQKDIAVQLGISQATVSSWLRRAPV